MGFKKVNMSLNHYFELYFNFTFSNSRICSKQDEYQDQYLAETNIASIHQKEELDAAEALTFLAGNFKSRWVK